MSAPPQAIAPNPHANLLNVHIQIANKMGFEKNIPDFGWIVAICLSFVVNF
jgi:hypothetical protein